MYWHPESILSYHAMHHGGQILKPRPLMHFTTNWGHTFLYDFPPFSLIPWMLQKIRHNHAHILVIIPLWLTQTWFTTALSMTTAPPMILLWDPLILLQDPQKQHPLVAKSLRLAAMPLSGTPSESLAFQNKLLTYLPSYGALAQMPNIGHIWKDGCNFVAKTKLMSLAHL